MQAIKRLSRSEASRGRKAAEMTEHDNASYPAQVLGSARGLVRTTGFMGRKTVIEISVNRKLRMKPVPISGRSVGRFALSRVAPFAVAIGVGLPPGGRCQTHSELRSARAHSELRSARDHLYIGAPAFTNPGAESPGRLEVGVPPCPTGNTCAAHGYAARLRSNPVLAKPESTSAPTATPNASAGTCTSYVGFAQITYLTQPLTIGQQCMLSKLWVGDLAC